MKQFDNKASMSILRIVAILTIIIIIFAGAYMVVDSEGNPFAEKTYIRSEIIVSGDYDATEGTSVAVMDITHEAVEERYVDQLSWARMKPTSIDVDVVIELNAIFENGSEKLIDIQETGYSLTTKWNYTEIIRITMGPVPEDVVEYELHVSVYRESDEPEDTASVSGVLGS